MQEVILLYCNLMFSSFTLWRRQFCNWTCSISSLLYCNPHPTPIKSPSYFLLLSFLQYTWYLQPTSTHPSKEAGKSCSFIKIKQETQLPSNWYSVEQKNALIENIYHTIWRFYDLSLLHLKSSNWLSEKIFFRSNCVIIKLKLPVCNF